MKQLGELRVADYMANQAFVVDDSQRLTYALRIMDEQNLTVLPVY